MERNKSQLMLTENKTRISRGISLDVWNARPYTRWEPNQRESIRKAYAGLARAQRSFMLMLAGQRGGWIINRHAVPGEDHVWPEIRPDGLVRTGPPTMHWHGPGRIPRLKPGYSVLEYGTDMWKAHCDRVDGADEEPYDNHRALQPPHTHESLAKYCFPPSEKVMEPWDHDHSAKVYENPKRLEGHMRLYHAEPLEDLGDGRHRHYRKAKSDDSLARRLDIHPMALPLLETAERVYFGIEGCLKADSILTAIIAEGRPESVFSVPSVSLWDAEEFENFLPALRGKQVVVVPDADWFKKREVITHARFAQRYLQHRGIEAVIAAPPRDRIEDGIKGVDDYLGPDGGGNLDGLEVLDLEESTSVPMYLDGWRDNFREDGFENMERMIGDLAFFAGAEGRVQLTHAKAAKILGCGNRTVGGILDRMRECGWITAEKSTQKDVWVEHLGAFRTRNGFITASGKFIPGDEEFVQKTRVTVAPDLRSTEKKPTKLGALYGS